MLDGPKYALEHIRRCVVADLNHEIGKLSERITSWRGKRLLDRPGS